MRTSKKELEQLVITNLSKNYSKKKVLSSINLTLMSGNCYMLVGENGSGKSTLLKLILGLIYPSSGVIKSDFLVTGYVPEKINLPMNIRVSTFLNTLAEIKGIDKEIVEKLLMFWELDNASELKLKELSKGMLQKVLIIQCQMVYYLQEDNKKSLFVFDEVLNGLDVKMQQKFLKLISRIKNQGSLVIITSHYVKYYEEVIDYVIEMPSGELKCLS